MKNTKYFKSEEEMNNYFPSGIPSNILAIVQGSADEAASLYTTSNNSPVSSNTMNMGGGGVTPTGTYNITTNGNYDVTTYAYSYVSVPTVTPTGTLLVMNPGQYDAASYAYVAVCKDYTDDYSGLLDESVGSYVGMKHAQTADSSDEGIGTLTSAIATEFGTAFGVNLTPYVGSNYAMFSDDLATGEVYGIFIDTNVAFTAAGYPTEGETGNTIQFEMLGQLKWKNANAGTGDVSSLVIGQASYIGPNNWIFDQEPETEATEYTFDFNDPFVKSVIERGDNVNNGPNGLGQIVIDGVDTSFEIYGYYEDGYWYVGAGDPNEGGTFFDYYPGRTMTDSDTITLGDYEVDGFTNSVLMTPEYDQNDVCTGEMRIYIANGSSGEEGEDAFSIVQ